MRQKMKSYNLKKYWALSKPSRNDTKDYTLNIRKLFNGKKMFHFFPLICVLQSKYIWPWLLQIVRPEELFLNHRKQMHNE